MVDRTLALLDCLADLTDKGHSISLKRVDGKWSVSGCEGDDLPAAILAAIVVEMKRSHDEVVRASECSTCGHLYTYHLLQATGRRNCVYPNCRCGDYCARHPLEVRSVPDSDEGGL
jgi:hypothetical protein